MRMQAALNALECNKRFVDVPWKKWDMDSDNDQIH